jgi:hypothetical protein
LNDKRIYLGAWGAPETQIEYDRVISEWLANRKSQIFTAEEITIAELCRDFWLHSKEYYLDSDGSPTSQLGLVKYSIRPLRRLYGDTRANDFGALAFRAVRNQWLEANILRGTVKKYAGILKQLFKWAASYERIDIQVYQ